MKRSLPLLLALAGAAALPGCRCGFQRADSGRALSFAGHAIGSQFRDDVRATRANFAGLPGAIARDFATSGTRMGTTERLACGE